MYLIPVAIVEYILYYCNQLAVGKYQRVAVALSNVGLPHTIPPTNTKFNPFSRLKRDLSSINICKHRTSYCMSALEVNVLQNPLTTPLNNSYVDCLRQL